MDRDLRGQIQDVVIAEILELYVAKYVAELFSDLAAKLQQREPLSYPTHDLALQKIRGSIAVQTAPYYD